MVSLIEELIKSIELWFKIVKKQEVLVNPYLDPLLLVPGIAGSILHAVDENGKKERVWVRILGADREFQENLWCMFDPHTGKTVSLDPTTKIVVPEERYGLYAIDVLDPDLIIDKEGVYYFHEMIEEMIKWGYKEGKTLFGFGYDFRQSNRLQEVLEKFSAKLESVYTSSGNRKINIITHSMGGLLVRCFMSLYSDVFEKYVKNWIAIAAPFQGAPGYITSCLLNGASFVEGWAQNFFVSKWSMHQLLIECPSIYELIANPYFSWENAPLLQIWRERCDLFGNPHAILESYEFNDIIPIMNETLACNMVECNGNDIPMPFNMNILKWANETHEVLARAKLPSTIKFYNIYGINYDTPNTVCYGSEKEPVCDLAKLPWLEAQYIYVNGDGSVPMESAKADGFDAVARVGVSADHQGILRHHYVFRILEHWLEAGLPDPFYNPINDYVIIPTEEQLDALRTEVRVVREDLAICKRVLADTSFSTASSPMRLDVSKPRTFGGSRDAKEVDNFLWMLEQYFAAANIREEEVKVRCAPTYLTDTTMLWWRRKCRDILLVLFEPRKCRDILKSGHKNPLGVSCVAQRQTPMSTGAQVSS